MSGNFNTVFDQPLSRRLVSGHKRRSFPGQIFEPLYRRSVAKSTASGLRKKPRLRRALFLNDFFTHGGVFCWKYPCHSVIVPLTTIQPKAPTAGLSNIAITTARKMCACNTARPARPSASLILARGLSAPVASPGQGVAPWTSPDALRLLDFRPGRFHQPRTLDHGGLRARPGPPDRGRLRSPSGRPSTRLSQPWTAPRESPLGTPGTPPPSPFPAAPRFLRRKLVGPSAAQSRSLPLLSAPPMRGCKPFVNST